jgi:hypothetical protein
MMTGALCVGIALAATAPIALAQLNTAIQTGEQATRQAASTQARINQLDDERSQAVREYRGVLQRVDAAKLLELQNSRLVQSQRAEIASAREQLGRVDEIVLQMTPMMYDMIAALQEFYAADLPFKKLNDLGEDERAARIARLAELMEQRADITDDERYRQIVEAYQAEMDYGRTIDTYSDTIEVDGETKTVNVFRYGRVSMTYLTDDGAIAGVWNRETKAWERLPDSYRSDIRAGINMAKQIAAPAILFAPVRKLDIGSAMPPVPAAPAAAPAEAAPAEAPAAPAETPAAPQ